MIFKLQRPLDDPKAPVLAYSEGRKNSKFLVFTDELRALFGDEPKVYVEAELVGPSLMVGDKVSGCDW